MTYPTYDYVRMGMDRNLPKTGKKNVETTFCDFILFLSVATSVSNQLFYIHSSLSLYPFFSLKTDVAKEKEKT